jgi:glycosyltransferase involved in cell wall biosynthesis
MKSQHVSIIIPVYNEKRTLGSIIEVVRTWKGAHEVIIVDDGSTDGTKALVKSFGTSIRFVRHATNKGKGHALATGILKSRGDVLLFLDGDMVGLTHSDLNRLSASVLTGKADMTLGLVRFWRWNANGPHPSITGVRAVKKTHIKGHLNVMYDTGYGVEFLLNHIHRNKRVDTVDLPTVYIMSKLEKMPLHDALWGYIAEIWHIGREYIRQRV